MLSQLFSARPISYLAIFISAAFILIYFLKWERFSRLAESIHSWGKSTGNGKVNWQKAGIRALNISSQGLILILILDEIGLLLQEWNISSAFFLHFRRLLELPGLSQLVFLANLALVIPATYYLSGGLIDQIKNQNSEASTGWSDYNQFKVKYSLFTALFVLTVTILFFLVQCLVYNEFGLSEDLEPVYLLIYVLLIFSGFITALLKITNVNRRISRENNPYKDEPWCEKNLFFFTFIIVFMSFAQTMITKVILLLSLVDWASPAVIKYIGKIVPVSAHLAIQRKSSYERILNKITSGSFWHKWNFFFLTTSSLALVVVYQFHCSPYPPSDSAFPKTETISGLYMLYMLGYLFTGKGKYQIAGSVLWTVTTITILYGTPVIFPSWYLPSIDPPGFSMIDVIARMTNLWTSTLFAFVIHLSICISSFLLYYSLDIKEFLIRNKYRSVTYFKKYLFIRFFSYELFYYTIFGFFFVAIFGSEFFSIVKSLAEAGFTEIVIFRIELILLLLAIFGYWISIKDSKANTINDIREEVKKFGEEGTLELIDNNVNLLKFYGKWNNKSNKRRQNLIYIILFGTFAIFITGCLYIPQLLGHKEVKLNWTHTLISSQLPEFRMIKISGTNIVFNSTDSLFCAESETGKLKWSLPVRVKCTLEVNENSVILLTENELFALSIDSCKRIWTADISGIEIPDNIRPKLSSFGQFTSIQKNNDIYIFDNFTGRKIYSVDISNYPESEIRRGILFLISRENSLQKIDQKGDLSNICVFADSVKKMHLTRNLVTVWTNRNLFVFNKSDKLQWMKSIQGKYNIRGIFESDSILCINFRDTIKGYWKEDGSERWSLSGYNFENAGIDIFNENQPFPALDSSCFFASKNNDLLIVDAVSGNIIRRFERIFKDEWILKPNYFICAGEYLATIGLKYTSLYSVKTGKKIGTHDHFKPTYNIDTDFFHGNQQAMRLLYCGVMRNEDLFVINQYGLISMKLKD
jgi:hypothetical protein